MNYAPFFEKIPADPETIKTIGALQKEFEKFWSRVKKMAPGKNFEKNYAQARYQEACMWLTRAVAHAAFDAQNGEVQPAQRNYEAPKAAAPEIIVKKRYVAPSE